jgi:hypothetical protein
MSTPTEHKTVQARILEYAEAIGWAFVSEEKEVIRDSKLDIGDRREDSDSKSLSSSRTLRFGNSEFRGFDRKERRDRKGDLDRSIWRQAVAKSADRKFSRRLRGNRLMASEHFCDSLSQNLHIV